MDGLSAELVVAVKNGDIRDVRNILFNASKSNKLAECVRAVDRYDRAILHIACENPNVDILQALIEYGADVNAVSSSRCSPLHLIHESACCEKEIVRLLLEHGAFVNAQDMIGRTPLHFAVHQEDTVSMKILLEHGADPNIHCIYRTYPLDTACIWKRLDTIRLLLSYGASINVSSPNPPFLIACRKGGVNVVELLIRCGADVNLKTSTGTTIFAELVNDAAFMGGDFSLFMRILECLWTAGLDLSDWENVKAENKALRRNDRMSGELDTWVLKVYILLPLHFID